MTPMIDLRTATNRRNLLQEPMSWSPGTHRCYATVASLRSPGDLSCPSCDSEAILRRFTDDSRSWLAGHLRRSVDHATMSRITEDAVRNVVAKGRTNKVAVEEVQFLKVIELVSNHRVPKFTNWRFNSSITCQSWRLMIIMRRYFHQRWVTGVIHSKHSICLFARNQYSEHFIIRKHIRVRFYK